MKLNHFKELDGVRALAALMVMFFHFFLEINSNNKALLIIKKFSIFGQTGVSLFFVLSGFLITRILINSKDNPSYFKTFYLRRSVRIFPLYYLYLTLTFIILPLIHNIPVVSFGQQIYFWVYLQNFASTFRWSISPEPSHFWSLSVEEHFYLFWPLLIYFLDIKKINYAIIITILVAFVTRIFLIKNGFEVFYFTFSRMDELAVGAILAILEIKGKLNSSNTRKFLLIFLLILLPTVGLWTLTTGKGNDIIQIFKFILLSFCYFSLIGIVITIKESSWLKKIFRLNPMVYTGKISYGLYVYHPLCFGFIRLYTKVDSVFYSFVLSFLLTYFIASISFYFFESKFLSLKKKFDYN